MCPHFNPGNQVKIQLPKSKIRPQMFSEYFLINSIFSIFLQLLLYLQVPSRTCSKELKLKEQFLCKTQRSCAFFSAQIWFQIHMLMRGQGETGERRVEYLFKI